ncbi:MAG: family 78 glycoside hydrolase catalytic domain, partial [Clostridia bacterium]|nr:family 78 glycoside hydrolase catalytic domain [Clostridia bacterium]
EITRENYYTGEDIDAAKYTGWDVPGFKEDSSWSAAEPAGINVDGGQLHLGSDAGTFTTYETFSGDYDIEAVITVVQNIAALEFGAKDGVASPCMWQLTPGGLRIHHSGWTDIETPAASVKKGKPVTLKLEIRGAEVTTYVDGKQVHTVKLKASDTRGALGIRSAVNESSSFDRITVSRNGEVIWEDNFDTADRTKWNYPGTPELRPAISGTRIIQEYKPVSCVQQGKAYILDFGQNMSGYVRLTVSGEKGQKYKIEYAEMLDENGNFFPNTTAHKPYSEYKLSGGDDVFEPRFFYTGFRYIRVTPPAGVEPDPNCFTACFVSDDLDQTGFIDSSDDRLNQVFNLYLMAQRSNLVGNYTDCPQREKNGWTGDASVTKEAAAAVLGDWSTAEAFLDTMLMDIKPDGRPQIVVPTVSTGESGAQYDITWASAYFVFPYQLYLNTGDKYYIERSYEQLLKIFEYARSYDKTGDGLVTHNVYGDWVGYDSNTGKLDTGFLSAAYFYYCGSLLSEMLEIIGEPHAELDAYLNKAAETLSTRYF